MNDKIEYMKDGKVVIKDNKDGTTDIISEEFKNGKTERTNKQISNNK